MSSRLLPFLILSLASSSGWAYKTDMLYSLGGPTTAAVFIRDIWHPALIEIVPEPYLSCAHLYNDRAEGPGFSWIVLTLYTTRPCGLVRQCCLHRAFIICRILDFIANWRRIRGTVAVVMISLVLPRCPRNCHHPVASFAILSANSFPFTSQCDGIHRNCTVSTFPCLVQRYSGTFPPGTYHRIPGPDY